MREAFFPQVRDLRLIRLAADGSFLFGADKLVVRAEWDGSVRTFPIAEDKRHVYEVRELPNGNYCVSSGYGATLEEWTADGTFVRKIGVGENTDDLFFLFFSGTQPLPDGHWVVCNWTGHGQDDSRKGPQLVEFDSQGRVVWIWHDPERAGTIHGVGILD